MVQEYIEEKEREIKEIKKQKLISLGLYQKVYIDENEDNENSEYDKEEEYDYETGRYYIKKVEEVTDEEFEKILELSKLDDVDEETKNPVATIIYIIAWVTYISGFVVGIINYEKISLMAFWWIVAFVQGTVFLGFAEIIKLLHDIKNQRE